MVRNNQLAFVQELVGNSNALIQQPARILPQIENQALQFTLLIEGIERVLYFLLGGFIETGNVHVSDSGTNHEMQIHAVARNFVANHGEFQRLIGAFAQDRNVYSRALGPFEQIGNVAGVHVVSGFAIHRRDNVAGMNARPVRWASREWRDDDDLIVARPDRHSHTVVLAALIFAQQRIRFRIEEIGVRIEHVQHAGNGAVVNRFIRAYRFGIILLDDVIDLGELLQALTDIGVAVVRGCGVFLGKDHSQESAKGQK